MIRIDKDIKDDEIKILGSAHNKKGAHKQDSEGINGNDSSKGHDTHWPVWLLLGGVAVLAVILMLFLSQRPDTTKAEILSEQVSPAHAQNDAESTAIIDNREGRLAYIERKIVSVNDMPLNVFIPHNAHAKLVIGMPDLTDPSILFACQAADIRADNGKINGAFVLKGEPIAWGLSKKGYCAIIGQTMTIGMAENSPLFEKATEEDGYFFRQYALVKNGQMIENNPKGKAIRKALCIRDKEIFMVTTEVKESLHDFAQALADMGVDNAIYLNGGFTLDCYRDKNGKLRISRNFSPELPHTEYENYLVWEK